MKQVILILLLISSLNLFADSQKCTQYIVNIKEAAIIEDIATPDAVITRLHRNDFVCVYNISENWAKLGDGWIAKNSITIKKSTKVITDNSDAVIGSFIKLLLILIFVLFIIIHIFTTPKSDGRFTTGFRNNAVPMAFKKKLIISFVLSLILSIIVFMNGHI